MLYKLHFVAIITFILSLLTPMYKWFHLINHNIIDDTCPKVARCSQIHYDKKTAAILSDQRVVRKYLEIISISPRRQWETRNRRREIPHYNLSPASYRVHKTN